MNMKTICTALALTALVTSASAQTASAQSATAQSATAPQVRPISPTRQAQPLPPMQTAPASRTSAVAVQASPFGTAGKQTIPGNLFGIEDRAIIIVGGKSVAAGDVKRALLQDVRQSAGPAVNELFANGLADIASYGRAARPERPKPRRRRPTRS